MGQMTKVAYFSPLPPQQASTSRYSEELLPHLCRHVQVDAYTDDQVAATQEVGRIYPLYGYRDFPAQRERYDQLVFQLGNSPAHRPILALFMRFGGVVTLHDLDLSSLVEAQAPQPEDAWGYLREVGRNEGLGSFLRTASDALLRRQWPTPQPAHLAVSRRVIQRATGLVVHSRAIYEHVASRHPEARLQAVPIGIPRPPTFDSGRARQALNLPPDAFVCISLGRLGSAARVHVAMQAFARLLERCPNSYYAVIGESAPAYPLQQLAQMLGIADRVRLPGHLGAAALYRYLAAADVGLCLAHPSAVEAPADLLRLMSAGMPVVVPSRGPYATIPDHCVVKVAEGAGELSQVVAALWALASHPPLRLSFGRQAARYVQANHALDGTAQRYAGLLDELSTVQASEGLLLGERTA